MMELSVSQKSLRVVSAILIQYRLVTDGQTNRQTLHDGYYCAYACMRRMVEIDDLRHTDN